MCVHSVTVPGEVLYTVVLPTLYINSVIMRLIGDKTVNTQKQVGGTQGSVCAHSITLRVFVYVCL